MEQRQPKLRYPLIPESFSWGLLLGVLLVFLPGPLFFPPIAAAATLIAPSATEYAALDGLAAAIAAVGILLILGAILVVKTVRARATPAAATPPGPVRSPGRRRHQWRRRWST